MNSAPGNTGLSQADAEEHLYCFEPVPAFCGGVFAFHDFDEVSDDGCAVAGVDSYLADELVGELGVGVRQGGTNRMGRIFLLTCHIHPALDSCLRRNDGLTSERGIFGVLPRPSLCRSLAASSWCQGVQLGASPSMMEMMLRTMRPPLSVCSMTACLSDSAKSVLALCSVAGWSSVEIICSDYTDGCTGCQGGEPNIDGQDGENLRVCA